MFVIYDSATPPEWDDSRRATRRQPGYLAYWNDFETEQVYVFDQVLRRPADVGHALLNLAWDVGADGLALSAVNDGLGRAVELAQSERPSQSAWITATRATIRRVMGFQEPGPGMLAASPPCEEGECSTECCLVMDPCCGAAAGIGIISFPTAPPPDPAPDEVIDVAMQASECCDNGGGPPSGCPPGQVSCGWGGCRSSGSCCNGIPCPSGGEDPCLNDIDCDGIPDDEDDDIDGDGTPNDEDDDIDGDGTPNDEDDDMDGDGNPNDEDPDPCGAGSGPCCTNTDPCDPECGDLCSPACVTCEDNDACCEGVCCNTPGVAAAAQLCCDPPFKPGGCCPDDECCDDGTCINDNTECCLGTVCAHSDGVAYCCGDCEGCSPQSPTGCCPFGGTVTPDEDCCYDGDPCTTDGYECANSGSPCLSWTCLYTSACDDGDPCTDDPCTPGTCNNKTCGPHADFDVDLDVDSNNDGSITAADDAQEADPFTPNTPGKWGWINNDDSDGDGLLDNATGNLIIDGANDLEDIGAINVGNVDTSSLNAPKLVLVVANPALIRVFPARTSGATAILGPTLTSPVDLIPLLGLPTGWTLGMEGVAEGTTTLTLTLMDGPTVLCDDTVRVTVVGLDITWETNAGQPIADANSHPPGHATGTLGFRVFPGATAPGGGFNHTVRVKVVTSPQVANIPVFLKAIDPDDPSANNDVVDQDLVGPDNRDTNHSEATALGVPQITTDANGENWTTFTVAHQPGDNHRVAATLKQTTQGMPTLDQLTDANVPPSGTDPATQAQVDLFIGNISPLLTVWRKLHVETDTMLRPTFAENTINIDWDDPQFPSGGPLVLDVTDQNGDDCFENGYIRMQAAGFPDLVSVVITFVNTSFLSDDNVHTNITQAQWGGRPGAGTGVMSDDDLNEANFLAGVVGSDIGVGQPPQGFLPLSDTSGLVAHYQPAYILPVVEGEHTSTAGIPFVKNMNNVTDVSAWNAALLLRGLSVSTPPFWTTYVYSAFQAEQSEDFDGELEATKGINTHTESLFGDTPPSSGFGPQYTGMCAIFVEALRDGFPDVTQRITVAHEMAHTLGVDHGTGLMDENVQTNVFSAQSLLELRQYQGP